ncbi:MAG: AmmeMemoRadiSam system protein B [Planctomycetota bacterium]|jgi:AmmeMemoRadiSam system protein B/AmmeMemoRadiSam system protein A
MDRQSEKSTRTKFLLGAAIVLMAAIAALLLRITLVPEPPPPIVEKPEVERPAPGAEEIAEPKKEPPKLAKTVLSSALAGRWYPADPDTLTEQIKGFFQKAQVQPTKDVSALVLPHAGYQYSGQTAAYGLKTLGKKYERVVVIGPSHRVRMEDTLSVPRVTHYQTPLGQVPLDVEFIDKLLQYPLFQNVPHAHEYEHSVQIEVPLLQYTQKGFKLVPIVAGSCSPETVNRAGAIIRSLIDDRTLVIASSDFVHYGSNYGFVPFTENIPEQIKELDMGAYDFIAALDCKGFLDYKQRTGATICGYVPVAILLSMLEPPVEARLAKYATSGGLTGDFTNSVSYLSVAFSGALRKHPEVEPKVNNPGLTEEDRNQLLTLARQSLLYFLKNKQVPEPSELGVSLSDAMRHTRAAFVTLKKNHRLRGCIGDIFPQRPLYRSVIINAINAGVNDRRFLPVTIDECSDITIEISALTRPEPIASADEIRIGTDGVVLSKNGRSAVFLPQVAPEQGWDVNQMLTQLSLKATLPGDAWKEGANFVVFQADVFGQAG